MTAAAERVVQDAYVLSEDERIEIAERLLESIETQTQTSAESWERELTRRSEELRSGAVEGVSWELIREDFLSGNERK